MADATIQSYEDLQRAIASSEQSYEIVDNQTISNRIGPPPPDVSVVGMAPPKAYDSQGDNYSVNPESVVATVIDNLPATQALKHAFDKNNILDPNANTQSVQLDNTFKPEGMG